MCVVGLWLLDGDDGSESVGEVVCACASLPGIRSSAPLLTRLVSSSYTFDESLRGCVCNVTLHVRIAEVSRGRMLLVRGWIAVGRNNVVGWSSCSGALGRAGGSVARRRYTTGEKVARVGAST